MVPAHRVLPGIVAEIVRKAPLSPEKVAFAWRSAVGSGMSRVTTIALRENATLEVEAADAHWVREIERSSRLILARLETMLGRDVVSRLSIRAAS